MAPRAGENRQVSTSVALIVVIVLGVVLAYLGVRLAGVGVYAVSHGEIPLGLLAGVLGIALVAVPVAVLAGQLLAMFRRRG